MTEAAVKALDEKFCSECCAVIKANAEICPKCGVRIGVLATANLESIVTPAYEEDGERKIGFWLGVGILFMPYIFAWFLLRDGYSKQSRYISFFWMALLIYSLTRGNST